MDSKEKKKIQNSINTITESLLTITRHGGYKEFDKFIKKRKIPGDIGLSISNVRFWLKKLKELKKDIEEEKSLALVASAKEKAKKIILRTLFLEEKVKDFIQETSTKSKDLYTLGVYSYHEVKRTKEPQLQLGILRFSEGGNVSYYTAKETPVREFSGSFNITKGNIKVVNLASVGNLDVKMQMQIYYRNHDYPELFLGSYITYHNDRIVRGTLVVINNMNENDIQPRLMGYDSNPESLREVSPVILEFLSIRKFSYKRVPDSIYSIPALKSFLNSGFHEHPQKRFIEREKPSIIIASPNSSIPSNKFTENQTIIDRIKSSIEVRFPNKLNIYIRSEQIPSDFKEAISPPSLKYIQRTRIFFLIYTPTDRASFSLVQLGWAMAYCKQIVILYQKGSLSENILRLDTFKNLFTFYEIGSLKEQSTQEQILNLIRRTIIGSLKEYLK